MSTVAEDHAAIGSRWPDVLAQLIGELPPRKRPGPCPACGGTDRFFADNRHGRGDWHCRGCDPRAGDGFDLLMRVHRWDLDTARQRALDAVGTAEQRPIARVAPAASYRPWADVGAYLWEQSQPIAGTIVETYLRRRGCRLPPADGDLRYLPARGDHPAAMVARITDIITGAPTSLHLTRLAADGSGRGERRLLAGHRKAGGCVRLWPDEAVTHGLAVAEGIESALCAAHAYSPVWSAIDAGNLAAFPLLSGIESLTVFADHDPAGMRAARAVAQRWADAGREVEIVTATEDGADVADLVAE